MRLTWDVDNTPDDNEKIVLPPYLCKAYRRRLQQDQACSKLTKQTKTHTHRPQLSRENLRYVEIHGGVAARPLEGEIEEDEEDAEPVTGAISGTRELGGHGCEQRGGEQTSRKAK